MKLKSVVPISACAMVALWSGSVFANSYSTIESKALVVPDGKLGQRLCYYEDKAYSAGAVVKVDNVLIICADENDFETNGSLKWVVLNKNKKAS